MRLYPLVSAAIAVAVLAAANAARAQTGNGYDLSWHAIGSGGTTTSSAGAYRVNGLAGQPAMIATGNGYTLNAGFWGAALQLLAGVPPRPSLPRRFALYAPSPNPSADAAAITFDLPRAGAVQLRVFDVNGRIVCRLADGAREAGQYHVAWDGRTDGGERVSPGVYFLDFRAAEYHATRRIVHL